MYRIRLWSVRHARGLRRVYELFSRLAPVFAPVVRLFGDKTVLALLHPMERSAKGLMFDCQECGQCVLSATGMACPMNCAKEMRNGPCGGVRENGHCEVKPEMRCVWVEAWRGSQKMRDPAAIQQVQIPVNNLLKGSSSWLRVVRHEHAAHAGKAAE